MNDKLISGSVSAGTGVTGLFGMISMIPDGITKVACLVGIIGTIIASAVTIRKQVVNEKISELTIKKLKKEIGDDGK